MSTKSTLLVSMYKKAIEKRRGKPYHPKTADLMSHDGVKHIATRLKVMQCRTYIEAVFDKYPADWCQEKFGVPFPPINIAFNRDNMKVMRDYIDRGRVHPV